MSYRVEVHQDDGDLVAVLDHSYKISYDQEVNRPHVLGLEIPATDEKAAEVLVANELWLLNDDTGTVIRKFRLKGRGDIR